MGRFRILAFSFFLSLFCICKVSKANNHRGDLFDIDTNLIQDSLFVNITCESFNKDVELSVISNPSTDGCKYIPVTIYNTHENLSIREAGKKGIALILAFPFPFGMLGLHRIYLGTKPYMPFAYIGTLGGCFGILPLIDFISILTANEDALKRFENNPKVFMWSK